MIQPKTRRPSNGKHKAPPVTLPPMPQKPQPEAKPSDEGADE